ncbi:MAG: molybdopterin-dependent oxidoreductase, partial [Deltaproteobacteria bacterium]|nr:molybdopterin-dependent oxidoreductase [Deltaproteobacteria bacterium]
MTTTHYQTCSLCEATCGLTITVEDGRVVSVRGDKKNPFSRGYLCPKGAAIGSLHHDPDRLRRPLVRRDGALVEVSWEEAFKAVEKGLMPIVEKHGRDAVGVFLGNPCAHTMAGALCMHPLLKALGSKNIFSASTVDQMPKHVSSGLMFGHPLIIPVPDIDRTMFMLILGADPLTSNGSLATAPNWPGRLRALKNRVGRLVVVDPRTSPTARLADTHLAIRPGGDAYLLMALINVLFADGLVKPGRLDDFTNGIETVRELCKPFSPSAVAEKTGLAPDRMTTLARDLAGAESAVVYGRMGTSTVSFGALTNWLVDVVNILTGNLDRPGGAMFPAPAHMPLNTRPGGRGWALGRWQSRVKGLNEVMGELPVSTLVDEMETEGDGQIRALLTIASNPAISLPNAGRISRALAALDYMVSIDFYVTASTRHADVILPPTGPLSTSQHHMMFYNLAVRNMVQYAPPVLAMPDDEMDKWQIMYKLALIFSGQGAGADIGPMDDVIIQSMVAKITKDETSLFHGRDAEMLDALSKHRGPERMLDFMLRTGAYGDGFGLDPEGLTLDKLKDLPHGLDLGPLKEMLPGHLKTPSGRIELAPDPLVRDVDRLRKTLDDAPSELVLVGRRHLRTNNSWLANIPALVSGPQRCVLHVNPTDAIKLGLKTGDTARVASRVGQLAAPVEVTDNIRPGVVSLPHGWGHDLQGVEMRIAKENGGINSNILADETQFDPLSNTSVLNGIPVNVTPA